MPGEIKTMYLNLKLTLPQLFFDWFWQKMAKNQANAKQGPLLSYWIGHILENKQKNKCVYIHELYDRS